MKRVREYAEDKSGNRLPRLGSLDSDNWGVLQELQHTLFSRLMLS